MDPSFLAALGLDPNDPSVQALYGGIGGQAPQQPQMQAPAAPGSIFQVGANGIDPLAPLPDAAQQPTLANSINDGINSVGRPSDQLGSDADAQKALDSDYQKQYKKLLRERKGEALLALGANLLSARTFGEGLSKGMLAYAQALREGRDSLKPQFKPIGDGEVVQRIDPVTDEATYQTTPYADIKREQLQAITDRTLANTDLRNQGSLAVAQTNTGSREKIADLQWTTRKDIANLQSNTQKWTAQLRSDTAKDVAEITAKNKGNSRATASLINTIVGQQQGLNQTTIAMQNLAPVLQWLDTGQLHLSLGQNAMRKVAMATGVGGKDPETQKYAQMRQVIEQNRNAILLAAKGVQTEGDAQRALNQILSSDANTETVKSQLKFLMDILKRNAENTRNIITGIKNQTGVSLDPNPPEENKTTTGVGWKIVG